MAQLISQFGNQTAKCIDPVFFAVIARLVNTVTAPEFTTLVKKCFTQDGLRCMTHLRTKVLRLAHGIVLDRIHLS